MSRKKLRYFNAFDSTLYGQKWNLTATWASILVSVLLERFCILTVVNFTFNLLLFTAVVIVTHNFYIFQVNELKAKALFS